MRTFSENRQTFLVDMIREWKSVRNGINMPQLVLQATLLLRGEILFADTKKNIIDLIESVLQEMQGDVFDHPRKYLMGLREAVRNGDRSGVIENISKLNGFESVMRELDDILNSISKGRRPQ